MDAEHFRRLLESDEAFSRAFRAYMEENFCFENLLFWNAVQKYKRIEDAEQRRLEAELIVDEFIASGAVHELNLESHYHFDFAEQVKLQPTPSSFDPIAAEIFHIMLDDLYPKYLQSSHHHLYLRSSAQIPAASPDLQPSTYTCSLL